MDLHRLEVFCKVVELGSFTKAGEALRLSQPTVSEHVRALETLVDEKLLDRLGREVLPTEAGRILFQYALKLLRLRQEAMQALAMCKGVLWGRLVVGASTIPGTYILPRIIGAFKAAHPSIQVEVRVSDTGETLEAVSRGDFEIGLVGSRSKERRLDFREVFSDELVLAVYPGHPWSGHRHVTVEELYQEPFILRESGSGTRMVMVRILEAHGCDVSHLSVVGEMGSTEAVRQSIKARIGVSILSRHAVADDLENGALHAVAIEGVRFHRPFYLVRRKSRQLSPITMAFLKHLEAAHEAAEAAETP